MPIEESISLDRFDESVSLDHLDVGSTPLRRRRLGGRRVIAMIGVLGWSAVGGLAVSWLTADRMTPVLEVSVDPPEAEISLDGQRVGIGAARLRLGAAGEPRELQVSASGYVTKTWRLDKALPPKRVVLQQHSVQAESVTNRRTGPAPAVPFRPVESWETASPPNASARMEGPPTRTRQGRGSQPTAAASSPASTEAPAADAVPGLSGRRPTKLRTRARPTEEMARPSPETSRPVAAGPAGSKNEPSRMVSRALGPAADSAPHEPAQTDNKAQLQMKIIVYQPPAVRLVD